MIDHGDYQWLRIEPVDAWFFRDGRPSNRGEDQTDLVSEFPPNAATVVGALRAALARQQGWDGRGSWDSTLNEVLGDGFDNLGKLRFLGPFLTQNGDLLFPMPRHVTGHTVDGRFVPVALLEPSPEPVSTDCGDIHLPTLPGDWRSRLEGTSGLTDQQRNKPPEPRTNWFVTCRGMSRILKGRLPQPDDCRHRRDLFRFEGRVGIQRDPDRRTTGQNAMYSPRYVRLKRNVALAMAVTGVPEDWTPPPLMPLGGESRLAGVERLASVPKLPASGNSAQYTTVIAVTPARFGDPWWGAGPGDDAAKLSSKVTGQVKTVALDRPRMIGGWDSRELRPIPLAPFVPPGTVWWIDGSCPSPGPVQMGDSDQCAYGNSLALVSTQA